MSFGLYPRQDMPGATPLFVAEFDLLVRDFIASRHIKEALLELEKQHGWEMDYRPGRKALDAGNLSAKYDVIIFDTAGRQEIDQRLVEELKRLLSH